jgi:hypothetical protein
MTPKEIIEQINVEVRRNTGKTALHPENRETIRRMASERGLYRFEPIDTEDVMDIIAWIEVNGNPPYVFSSLDWWFEDPEPAKQLRMLFG